MQVGISPSARRLPPLPREADPSLNAEDSGFEKYVMHAELESKIAVREFMGTVRRVQLHQEVVGTVSLQYRRPGGHLLYQYDRCSAHSTGPH